MNSSAILDNIPQRKRQLQVTVHPADQAAIEQAASLVGYSPSDFVSLAAYTRAMEVISGDLRPLQFPQQKY